MIQIRLWHVDMIEYLDRERLIAQLRECVAIAKDIYTKGKTNHILINRIMDYPLEDFQKYCDKVIDEMEYRGYNVSNKTKEKLGLYLDYEPMLSFSKGKIFDGWHNTRYLRQCYFNLQEKADCGGIKEDEWNKIKDKFKEII